MSDKRPYPEVKTVVDQCVSDVLGRVMLDLPREDHNEALSQVIERLTHVIERASGCIVTQFKPRRAKHDQL